MQGSALGTLQDADDDVDNHVERAETQQAEITRLTHHVTGLRYHYVAPPITGEILFLVDFFCYDVYCYSFVIG